jgi:hypothetical protein
LERKKNKKFWEELIYPLPIHKPRVNNLFAAVTMEHKKSKPQLSKAHLTNLNFNNFKIIEATGLKIIASRSL